MKPFFVSSICSAAAGFCMYRLFAVSGTAIDSADAPFFSKKPCIPAPMMYAYSELISSDPLAYGQIVIASCAFEADRLQMKVKEGSS